MKINLHQSSMHRKFLKCLINVRHPVYHSSCKMYENLKKKGVDDNPETFENAYM